MINFTTNTTLVADNKVTFCGLTYFVTDKEAEQLRSILDGMVSSRDIEKNSVNETKAPVTVTKSESKTPYIATKDFTPKFEIKEQTGNDGTKLFCISRKNGWTKAEKKLMNSAIKALKGIKEIEVSAKKTTKDGKEVDFTFKAWGYNTESTAKKHFKELPTVFTVAQLNGAV